MPGIDQLSAAQFSEILVSIADLAPGDYALGVTKMFLKAGKGKFLEDLKDKPVDEARASSSSSSSSGGGGSGGGGGGSSSSSTSTSGSKYQVADHGAADLWMGR